MTDRPDLTDRAKALKDAEAALVAARLLRQRLWDPRARLTRVMPYQPTDLEIVVDAVLASIVGVLLTPEEAGYAADWHDFIVDQGGDVPAEETETALRLRRGAAS